MSCMNVVTGYKEYLDSNKSIDIKELDKVWIKTLLGKRSGLRRQMIEAVVEANGGDNEIAVQYNGGAPKAGKLLDMSVEGDEIVVYLDSGVYRFNRGATISKKLTSGQYIEMPVMEVVSEKQMGASLDDVGLQGEFEQLQDDIFKDSAKALKVFDEVRELDGVKIDDEYAQHLRELLATVVEENFIPKVTMQLDRKAQENGGTFSYSEKLQEGTIKLAVSGRPRQSRNEQSAVEKYVHEVVHAATEFALASKDPATAKSVRKLRELREKVRSSVSKEAMVEALMPKNSIDAKEERETAEKLYEYMFANTYSGRSEFLVHAVTNKEVMELLKTVTVNTKEQVEYNNVFEQLVGWLKNLLDTVMLRIDKGSKDLPGDKAAMDLVMEFGRANNKLIKKKIDLGIVGRLIDVVDKPVAKLIEKYADKLEKGNLPSRPKVTASRREKAIYYGKVLKHMVMDDRARGIAEKTLDAMGMRAEGMVQAWVNKLRDSDALDKLVEDLGLMSQKIDQARETTAAIAEMEILEAFKEHPSKEEMEAMTLVGMDTDLEVVWDLGKERVQELLKDEGALDKAVKEDREAIKSRTSKEIGNYYVTQAKGLGYYIATHKANAVQLLNARNIAVGLNRKERIEYDAEMEQAIDRLATLEGLKYTDKGQKKRFAELLERDADGVENFIQLHRAFKKESEAKLFNRNEHLKIKGYTKELFNEDVTIEIAPLSKYREMKKKGFELKESLNKAEMDASEKQMGIYVSKDYMSRNYNRDAMRLTDWNRRGTTLTEIRQIGDEELARKQAKLDVTKITLKTQKLVEMQEQGTFDFEKVKEEFDGLSPVINEYGMVTDYRYMMSKRKKVDLLDQDLRAPLVLARMQASIQDKVDTKVHNKQVVDAIKKDMQENYRAGQKYGRNDREYIVISKDSANEEVRDIYKILPKEVKKEFDSMEVVAVRRDMLYAYFGFRDATIANAPIVRLMPPQIKQFVRVAEHLWKELIKVSKVDIVIRTPMVLVGNVVSNAMYSIQMGENPADVMRLQLEAVRELRGYIDMHRELVKLKMARKAGNPRKYDLGKIAVLEEDLKGSPVASLIDAGMYQAIIEDVSINEFKSSNKWTRKINEKLEGAPSIVRNGLNIIYVTEQTKLFKLMTTATQFSDFSARYAQYHLLKRRGVDEQVALKEVLDAFINYNGNDKMSKYLNDIGLVMFTKYFQRIQRVIRKNATKHPMYVLLSLLAQETVLGDIDDISDQSMFIKDLDVMMYNPLDHVMRAITPTAFEYASDAYGIVTR